MTIKELSQLYWLKREIEDDEKRLKELEAAALSLGSPNLSGNVKIQGDGSSRIERMVSEIIDTHAVISAKRERCIHERNRLEKYIASVPDSHLRQMMTYRFVDGLSWTEVACRVGGNTKDSVRKACKRFVEKTS